jgi:hypothetical protein
MIKAKEKTQFLGNLQKGLTKAQANIHKIPKFNQKIEKIHL